ncbi:carboxypeptidase regulatory-like domain-containing protein [Acinetobacter sp. ANC 5579]|uniref:carboxypeptidase regulatory-like domain-containing protein n=1 Tax=Acinetobacter amyesii TaxID=2942470 RepID=UPI0020C07FA0|nr:carboxypeptidase regulatory-like domain-containing protein [Acinetobacter amyesii]MCL6234013.1 carboxypeptidase regulatory-like domain-containing protein [Acinetobacter amyesii]
MSTLIDITPLTFRSATNDGIIEFSNGLKISGKVLEKNIQIPCRVRLFEKLSGRLIEDKVTDHHGNYEFNQLTASKFFIVAHHPMSQFNAVIQDNVVPK